MRSFKKMSGKRKKILEMIGGILTLTIAGLVIWTIWGENSPLYLFSKEARAGEMELKEAQKRVDTENFHFQINASPVFENGDGEGSLMITNPPDNGYNMQVTIILDEGGEEIYKSDILVPGNRVGYGSLSKELKKGTYAATAVFDILDLETNESVGQVSAALSLTVHK